MRRILGLAVSLGLLASATANKANEESPEATLTRIERDFAETQITKDTKAVSQQWRMIFILLTWLPAADGQKRS